MSRGASPPVRTVVVDVRGPLGPVEADRQYERVQALLNVGTRVVCAVHGSPDLGVVDLLTRISLVARRRDASLLVRSDGQALGQLLELTGLRTVVPLELETGREPEAGKQRGIQEVVDVRDPAD